jgi:starvation-inducible DNA-binding protein
VHGAAGAPLHGDDNSIGGEVAGSATGSARRRPLSIEKNDETKEMVMETIAAPMAKEKRVAAAGYLDDLLVDLITLSLNAKQAHWHVTGRSFLPVHEQLDVLATDVRDWADEVAERAITLGVPVDGRPSTVGAVNALKELPDGFLTDVEAVTEIGHQVAAVAERIRTQLDPLGEADLATQDLAIEVVRGLEKHLWMLQAQVAQPPVDAGDDSDGNQRSDG